MPEVAKMKQQSKNQNSERKMNKVKGIRKGGEFFT